MISIRYFTGSSGGSVAVRGDYERPTPPWTPSPKRYDLVLDTAGLRSLSRLRRALTPHGTLVIVGGEGGRRLGGVQRVFRAALLTPFVRHRLRGLVSAVRGPDLEELRETIEAGKLTPVLDRTYPLADAVAAIEYVQKGHSADKVVITV